MDRATTSSSEAIAAALHRQGLTTQAQQAELLAESREQWSGFVLGYRAPTVMRLESWLQAADAAGHTLHLTLDPHIGWICKVAS